MAVRAKKRAARPAARRKANPRPRAAAPPPPPPPPPSLAWGLALSGGGSRGAFAVGALAWLRDHRAMRDYPVVAGTSTGALIAAMIALGKWDALEKIYASVTTRQIVRRRYGWLPGGAPATFLLASLTGAQSVYETREGLEKLIRQQVDPAALAASPVEAHFVAVDMQTGEIRSFNNREDSGETLLAGLLASACQPVLMPLVKTNPAGHQYADGGLREYAPLAAVFGAAARPGGPRVDRILAISHGPEEIGPGAAHYGTVVSILARTIAILTGDVASNDVRTARLINALLKLRERLDPALFQAALAEMDPSTRAETERHLAKRNIPLFHILPAAELPMDPLEFDPKAMRAAIEQGAVAAQRLFP
ncbi:MAG: patatin-like phospholipase family protein [Planctomycetaceae bacterium]